MPGIDSAQRAATAATRHRLRIAVATTHPIQYQVPWLQRLAARDDIDLQVYFAMLPDAREQGREFGVAFAWDLDLLAGYRSRVLQNQSRRPSLTTFSGCDTPEIVDEIRAGRFDAVIVNGWGSKTALQALYACRRHGVPCLVRGEANGLRPRAWWKRWLHRALIARYSACLAIGTRNRDYYLAAGVPPSRIFPTPYCIDNARFAASADAQRAAPGRAALCTHFGLEPQRTTFLFSGKFVDKKHPLDAIAALRVARAQGADVQLLMVGDGPLRATLETAGHGLPVRFAGFLNQSQMAAAYAAGDCLVLPSDSGETWGLVVNEAMASGLPVIVSDQVGCAADLVQPGVTGDVYPCRDVHALAARMQVHAADRNQLLTMGMNARALVFASFSFELVVDGVLAALHAVAPKTVDATC
ncbi:MAG: glycosyltransferase family 4 protein [Xanthomonadales bacterium]|jgi:glycosyltransferase involved in cell wall biosynthesis|nr:glycosyltransferase family 4 protein [Xanthomonadales bacterium]